MVIARTSSAHTHPSGLWQAHRAVPCARQNISRCCVSKTTKGQHTTPNSTDVAPQQQPAAQEAPRKSIQDHTRDMHQRLDSLVQFLTPKQEGDAGDMLMIGISMVVFIWLAMQMYRLYYYTYLQLGVMDMMQ